MRKAFNFFHSYYEVAKELNDKDRLQFLDALLKKQFTNQDTELNGMAKFAYLSQKHSIESQVKGYIDKTGDIDFKAYEHPSVGGYEGPSIQEKGKEKGKEKGEEKDVPSLEIFMNYFKELSIELKLNYDAYSFTVTAKYENWVENGWKDGNGTKIKNWKTKLKNTIPYLKPIWNNQQPQQNQPQQINKAYNTRR